MKFIILMSALLVPASYVFSPIEVKQDPVDEKSKESKKGEDRSPDKLDALISKKQQKDMGWDKLTKDQKTILWQRLCFLNMQRTISRSFYLNFSLAVVITGLRMKYSVA